jgi:hypothetical protein
MDLDEQAMTEHEIAAVLREVTDEEVAFYHEYGWVMMPQLVAPNFAAELLRVGRAWAERNGQTEIGPGKQVAGLARKEDAEPFRSFMFSQRMAHNATRLVNRKRLKGVDMPLRYRVDLLLNKPPGAAGEGGPACNRHCRERRQRPLPVDRRSTADPDPQLGLGAQGRTRGACCC